MTTVGGPRILIAVKSYASMMNQGAHEVIRDTWGKRVIGADVRFFYGGSRLLHGDTGDEVFLHVEDDYEHLALKVNKILEWALDKGYDYIMLVDTDTFLIPDRLRLGPIPWGQGFDYAGWIVPWSPRFAFGGCGYIVSKYAANYILGNLPLDKLDDVSIGKLLFGHPTMRVLNAPIGWNRGLAWHFPKAAYAVSSYSPHFPWMRMMSEHHLQDKYRSILFWTVMIGGCKRQVTLSLMSEDKVDDFDHFVLQHENK